jgi:hypothetical protein
MPVIKTFEQAKKEFQSRTAVRGQPHSMRRLGGRYEKEKWLKQEMLEGVEVYIAGYYDTELVRYYPTHMEFSLGGYPSLSTKLFIQGLTNTISFWNYYADDHVPRPFSHEANKDIESRVTLYAIRGIADRHIDKDSWYKVYYDKRFDDNDNYLTPKKFKVDRKLMKEITREYQPFLKYADSMSKLNNDYITDEATQKYINTQTMNNKNSLANIILNSALDESQWWYAYYALARQTYSSVFNPSNREWEGKITIRGMKNYLYNELKKNSPQVLVEVKPETKYQS